MFRRRGQVGLIAITAIVTILVTVGVTYAVQNILATRQLAASAKIDSLVKTRFEEVPAT